MIDPTQLSITKLKHNSTINPFDCGDLDLNGFLLDDALDYLNERMAITYIVEYQDMTVAYFCLLNDKVVFNTKSQEVKYLWNRFNRKHRIPNQKRKKVIRQ